MAIGIETQKFMAPEIINKEKYDEKVDVYSFGVLVYFILSGSQMPKIPITQIGTGKKAEIQKRIHYVLTSTDQFLLEFQSKRSSEFCKYHFYEITKITVEVANILYFILN